MGMEMTLLIFNIMTFTFFDFIYESTVVSFLLSFLVNSFLMKVRHDFGEDNISEKTMIDERFLIWILFN